MSYPPRLPEIFLPARVHCCADVEPDGRPDLAQGQRHLVLNGFEREVQEAGHFFILEAIVFYQFKYKLAARRQLVNGLLNPVDHFGGNQQLFGIKIYAAQLNAVIIRQQNIFLLLAQVVEGGIFR
jgi:hypothetical protein